MEDEAQSYWRATAKAFEPPPAELPSRTDVVVVGAGFTGVSAARVLAERGAAVAVLDAQSLGWGASTRNGGMMIVGLKHGPEVLVKQYGEELGRRKFETSIDASIWRTCSYNRDLRSGVHVPSVRVSAEKFRRNGSRSGGIIAQVCMSETQPRTADCEAVVASVQRDVGFADAIAYI
jgi:glycine/D-amino acid oxidase-like deaminating enzyme